MYDGHGGRAAVDFVAGRLGNNVVAAAEKQRLSEKASSPAAADHVAAAIRAAYLATDSEFLSQVSTVFNTFRNWKISVLADSDTILFRP